MAAVELIVKASDLQRGDDMGLDEYDGQDAETRIVATLTVTHDGVVLVDFYRGRKGIVLEADDDIEIEREVVPLPRLVWCTATNDTRGHEGSHAHHFGDDCRYPKFTDAAWGTVRPLTPR